MVRAGIRGKLTRIHKPTVPAVPSTRYYFSLETADLKIRRSEEITCKMTQTRGVRCVTEGLIPARIFYHRQRWDACRASGQYLFPRCALQKPPAPLRARRGQAQRRRQPGRTGAGAAPAQDGGGAAGPEPRTAGPPRCGSAGALRRRAELRRRAPDAFRLPDRAGGGEEEEK